MRGGPGMFRGTFLVYSERRGAKRAGRGECYRRRGNAGSGFGGESEVQGLRLAAGPDFDFLGLGAQRFMPGSDGVAAGRKIRQEEAAIIAGDGKVRRP